MPRRPESDRRAKRTWLRRSKGEGERQTDRQKAVRTLEVSGSFERGEGGYVRREIREGLKATVLYSPVDVAVEDEWRKRDDDAAATRWKGKYDNPESWGWQVGLCMGEEGRGGEGTQSVAG
jgi:hypothetical protein